MRTLGLAIVLGACGIFALGETPRIPEARELLEAVRALTGEALSLSTLQAGEPLARARWWIDRETHHVLQYAEPVTFVFQGVRKAEVQVCRIVEFRPGVDMPPEKLAVLQGVTMGKPSYSPAAALVKVGGWLVKGLTWEPYTQARWEEARGRKVVLYFGADWCGPCHALEEGPFRDPGVVKALEPFVRLKVDFTDPHDRVAREAARAHRAGGVLPALLFFDAAGREIGRIYGFRPEIEREILALAWGLPGAPRAEKGPTWEPYTPARWKEARGKPVVLYFVADWAIVHMDLEEGPFRDPRVVEALERFVRLKVDVSDSLSPEALDAMYAHQVEGAPILIFFDAAGRETGRIEGFKRTPEFLEFLWALPAAAPAEKGEKGGLLEKGLTWEPYTKARWEKARGKPVVLYFMADGNLLCDILEKWPFRDSRVVEALERFVRLKVDLSHQWHLEAQEAKRAHQVDLPPVVILFNEAGKEMGRITGYSTRWVSQLLALVRGGGR